MMIRKKWWEVAQTKDENDFFNFICRNPKFGWRTVESAVTALHWDMEKLNNVLKRFINNKIVLVKRNKTGLLLGYWELVDEDGENYVDPSEEDENANLFDPNLI